jgi:hypothetical protein
MAVPAGAHFLCVTAAGVQKTQQHEQRVLVSSDTSNELRKRTVQLCRACTSVLGVSHLP